MRKHARLFLTLAISLILAVLPVSTCFCAGNTVGHPVANLDVTIFLPQGWYYGDRGITDNDPFCTILGKTAEEFKEQYLYENIYICAYEPDTRTMLTLDVFDNDLDDFTALSDPEITAAGEERFEGKIGEEDTFISKGIVKYGRPYYKLVLQQSNGLRMYQYDTVMDGKRYLFSFLLKGEYDDGTVEGSYDSVMESVMFADGTAGPIVESDILQLGRNGEFSLQKNLDWKYYTPDSDLTEVATTAGYLFGSSDKYVCYVVAEDKEAIICYHPTESNAGLTGRDKVLRIIQSAYSASAGLFEDTFFIMPLSNGYVISQKTDTFGPEMENVSAYIFTEHGIIDIASVSKPEYEPFTLVNALVHAIIFADDNPAVD